jgi:flagellar hook protein FlgE
MIDSIYIGLSGLLGFSAGLKNISNDVANVNTVGYKGSSLPFADLFYQLQPGFGPIGNDASGKFFGSGVTTGNSVIIFKQGDAQQTGNDLDTEITGNGFFVVHQGGKTTFTRNGQFSIDAHGFLTTNDGSRVQGLVNGQLQDISIDALRLNSAQPTTTVKFSGNLTTDTSGNTPQPLNVTVIDSKGASHTLQVTFAQQTTAGTANPKVYTVNITESVAGTQVPVDNTGVITFDSTSIGAPVAPSDKHTFTFTPSGGGTPMTLTFDFGTPGASTGLTNFSGASTATVKSSDGFGVGSITKTTFDSNGTLTLTYSNGQTATAGTLALAWFDFLQGLTPVGQSSFENDTGQEMHLGTANTTMFGNITGGSVEASNVDLGQQFTDLIIVQRGYQASSQVISVANDMIQQTLDIFKPSASG